MGVITACEECVCGQEGFSVNCPVESKGGGGD